MAGGQIYNQYTKCVQPSRYTGLYLGGGAFLAGTAATIALLFVNPSVAPLTAILTGIGYCRWWLYERLVCLGKPNVCTVGLVLRTTDQQDQGDLGKFDTDFCVDLLLPPNALMGDQDWYNNMNSPQASTDGYLMQDQASPKAPASPEYVQMRNTYTSDQIPYGFSGEHITGADLQDHRGTQVLTPIQTEVLGFANPPDWQPNQVYGPFYQVKDSNGGIETVVSPEGGVSGSSTPAWPNPDPRNWHATAGHQTSDNTITWRYDGPVPAVGILQAEFEGAGVWNLYQVLLVATPAAVGLAVGLVALCAAIPLIGWVTCLIAALIFALIVAGTGALAGLTDSSAESDVKNQVGGITPGKDVLLIKGTWVWDGGHIPQGWNELHPVLYAQRIACVTHDNLIVGRPWDGLPQFSPANLKTTLEQMCEMVEKAESPATQAQHQRPQNKWQIHPLVDGCRARMHPPSVE